MKQQSQGKANMKRLIILAILLLAASSAAAKESSQSTPTWAARSGPCLIVISMNGYVINANALSAIIPKPGRVEYRFARHQEIEVTTPTPQAEAERVVREIDAKCGGAK
jgi:hypothetical protein